MPELEEELLLDELLLDELLDDDELLLEEVRPELELLDELLDELAAPSGPLQAARAMKLRKNRLRGSRLSEGMAGLVAGGCSTRRLRESEFINGQIF